jgi:hypothetical protein
MARNDVLIIGAGPSGLFAAAELARHGVKARLVEREVIDAVLYDLYLTFDSAAGDGAAPNRRWRRRSMPTIDDIWLAALTKDEDDAGSKNRFNLTVNIDGADAFRHDFLLGWNLTNQGGTGLQDGQAGLEHAEPTAPFDANQLTNSSVRLGLRGDDAWAPKHVMVIGRAQEAEIAAGRFVALAMATDIERWLSADGGEGKLTMPVRLVRAGTSNTLIRRVLLLVYTDRGSDTDTESDLKLQIHASGQLMLDQKITHDLNRVRAYWHFLPVERPFTRADVASKGGIRLSILGTDAWLPTTVFVFGLDAEEGPPREVVTLSAIPKWDLGWLSTDTSEGAPSVSLPVSN